MINLINPTRLYLFMVGGVFSLIVVMLKKYIIIHVIIHVGLNDWVFKLLSYVDFHVVILYNTRHYNKPFTHYKKKRLSVGTFIW